MITNPIIPIWLCFLILLLLLFFLVFDFKNKKIIFTNIKDNIKKNWTKIVIIFILFLTNCRFMILSGSETIVTSNLNVLFVIDTTISMDAKDYNDTRISLAKKQIKEIVNQLPGARFAIITFNNKSRVLCPYTRDTNFIYESIDVLKTINYDNATGSNLNSPIQEITNYYMLNNKSNNEKNNILFFISDGEVTDESKIESYSSISQYINGGAVLGYGTTAGSPIYISSESGIKSTLKYNSDTVISKIDENNLKSIASDLNIPYIQMKEYTNIDSILSPIKSLNDYSPQTIDKANYDDTYYIFVFLMIPFFLIDINKYRRIVL